METLFTKIAKGEIPSYIWRQDDQFMAFLTPFPNTRGLTVVAPKQHYPSYAFSIEDSVFVPFMKYVKETALILDSVLGVARTAMVLEGTGIDHLHAKLYPLHGRLASQTDVWADHVLYFKEYAGYISTAEGPEADHEELSAICEQLRKGS